LFDIVVVVLAVFVLVQAAAYATRIYLHCYMSHRALVVRGPIAMAFRVFVWTSVGIRPRVWAAIHRKHHAMADNPGDPYSVVQHGFWMVMLGTPWLYRVAAKDPTVLEQYGKGLKPDKWDRWLFDHGWLGLTIGITALLATCQFIGLGYLVGVWIAIGHMLGYLLIGGVINAIAHRVGTRPYSGTAANSQLVALLVAGEGLHNNHHFAPHSPKFSLHPGEFDPAWPIICVIKRFGGILTGVPYEIEAEAA
jgi:stearoyl-CoA desaturase (Delta-9 desaturase)